MPTGRAWVSSNTLTLPAGDTSVGLQSVCVCLSPPEELHLSSVVVWDGLVFPHLSLGPRHVEAGIVHPGKGEADGGGGGGLVALSGPAPPRPTPIHWPCTIGGASPGNDAPFPQVVVLPSPAPECVGKAVYLAERLEGEGAHPPEEPA